MLSAIFVDRPRLAIVIAIVTTIAGALALFTIPIAQYPDIVPPQVSVTTFYPGANSAVVPARTAVHADEHHRAATRPAWSAEGSARQDNHQRTAVYTGAVHF